MHRARFCPSDFGNKPLGICLVLFSVEGGIVLELYWLA